MQRQTLGMPLWIKGRTLHKQICKFYFITLVFCNKMLEMLYNEYCNITFEQL